MKTLLPKRWKVKVIIFAIYFGLLFLWYYMGWGCIFKRITGITCPGCGLTRAWFSTINGKIAEAFRYHPMFWSIPILVFYLFYDCEPFKNQRLNYTVIFLIALGWIVNYLLKILFA